MEDFARVQKEIERRTKKKRKYESSSSALIDEINWPEPQKAASTPAQEQAREINWPESGE
jgi:hypothetical protein